MAYSGTSMLPIGAAVRDEIYEVGIADSLIHRLSAVKGLAVRPLSAGYGLPVRPRHLNGLYRRYSGDMAELAKGEILAWTAE